jgi:hypothetical protein
MPRRRTIQEDDAFAWGSARAVPEFQCFSPAEIATNESTHGEFFADGREIVHAVSESSLMVFNELQPDQGSIKMVPIIPKSS